MLSMSEIRACRPKRFIVIKRQAKPGQAVRQGWRKKGKDMRKKKGGTNEARQHA